MCRFVTIVEKNAAHTSFGLGILECLRLPSEDRPSSPSVPKDVYNQLAKLIIDALDVSKLFQRASRDWGPRGCACAGPVALKPSSSGAVDALQLANTFSDLLTKGADSLVARFANKIVADVGLIPHQAFASLWLPFLGSLLSILEKHKVPLSTPRYRHLFAAILDTYVIRCTGAVRYKWAPKPDRILCMCRVCILFGRFLRSSVSAASFSSWTESEMDHINRRLVPHAKESHRCRFRIKNGLLVVRKLEDVDSGDRHSVEVMGKAAVELEKLDNPALRAMLGAGWDRVRRFLAGHNPKRSRPVPIESLEDPRRNPPGPVCASQTPVSTSAPAPLTPAQFGSLHQALGGSYSLDAPRQAALLRTPAAPLVVTPAPTVQATTAALSNRAPPLPATPPSTQPRAATGYSIFAHELGVRLSMMKSFTTPQSIQNAISKRWEAMSLQDRQQYDAKAASLQRSSSTSAPSLAVPFDPHRDPLPSTPKPSPSWAAGSSQPAQPQGSPNVARQHVAPTNRRVSAITPASTTRSRHGSAAAAATFQSLSSSRVLGAVSASRLNSVRGPRGHAKIKTEAVPRLAASQRARRRPVEVIDLTGDD